MAILEMENQKGGFERYVPKAIQCNDSLSFNSEDAPCRCQIHLEGLEWFLYNRTPSFDAIVERMQDAERKAQNNASGKPASSEDSDSEAVNAPSQEENETVRTAGKKSTARTEVVEGMFSHGLYFHIHRLLAVLFVFQTASDCTGHCRRLYPVSPTSFEKHLAEKTKNCHGNGREMCFRLVSTSRMEQS